MYEFDFTADVCKPNEYHSKKRVEKTVKAPNRMAAFHDHTKHYRKKGLEVYTVTGLRVFRLKYGTIREEITLDQLWELERQAEKMVNITT